ncbi:hypothetical protein H4R20_002106 [Coemansia guatemalensis]|uniref:Uncharacterized protein n=1 Tax=Coemansia guatemalensis TaxID=2761395 RepID=A0A9W8I4H3_9FUNG|nr:hypothetical protein H4R20_002106 [Coemansia guatemalensis]
MYECNDDFYCWDKLYLAVTKEQVRQHIVHQLDCPKDVEHLLDNPMTGATALHKYPSGCPLPAAIKLLCPLMHEGTKLVYTLHHPMSDAAQAMHEKFVETRLNYSIGKKTRAHAQMPVFMKPNPNTDAQWVLFDDLANNELNMVHMGVQLALPAERIQFLKNTKWLSSVDLASFFTSMWLAEDMQDFWCYQGGSHGCIQTTRVVQGNSESPAIAQSFIQHVLSKVPELQDICPDEYKQPTQLMSAPPPMPPQPETLKPAMPMPTLSPALPSTVPPILPLALVPTVMPTLMPAPISVPTPLPAPPPALPQDVKDLMSAFGNLNISAVFTDPAESSTMDV